MTGWIVAVSGLCGAGKSTAVCYLARSTGGEVVYFGATVRRVVRERGLPETSASEPDGHPLDQLTQSALPV